MPPQVSVVMSVYNGQPHLRAAIESILEQTYTDYEFLIIDDASTDQSREIIQSFDDPRVRLLENSENLGLTRSLNRGLGAAQGAFVARMDADDISLPDRLETQVETLRSTDAQVVFSRIKKFDTHAGKNYEVCETPWGLTHWRSLFANAYGAHPSVMFKRNAILALGGYNETYRYAQDYELWDRCVAESFRFEYVPKVLLEYFLRSTGVSRDRWQAQDECARRVSFRAMRRHLPEADENELLGLRWLFLPWESQVSQDSIAHGLASAPQLLAAFMASYQDNVRRLVRADAAASIAYRLFQMGLSNRRLGYSLIRKNIQKSWSTQTLVRIIRNGISGWLKR